MSIPFYKYEGLGNDFIIVMVNDLPQAQFRPEFAKLWCDRHLGIGADGVIIIDNEGSNLQMRVVNADGSVPEMCGNGIRCVALHAVKEGMVNTSHFEIQTDSGPHACNVDKSRDYVVVQMRPASFSPPDVPLHAEVPWVDHPLEIGNREVRFSAVSMGNPHLVTFDDVGEQRFEWAEGLEHNEHFPEGANVGFAQFEEPDQIKLHVWERGVGWTMACGTGACAAAAAAVETGRSPRGQALNVTLPGGSLEIRVEQAGAPISMGGPARRVFQGEV